MSISFSSKSRNGLQRSPVTACGTLLFLSAAFLFLLSLEKKSISLTSGDDLRGTVQSSINTKPSILLQEESSSSAVPSSKAGPLPFPAKAFWHIGNAGNPIWKLVVKEQTSRLRTSGVLDSMNVSATYVAENADEMPTFIDSRIQVEYGGQANQHEWVTLQKLEDYCMAKPTARVIYFHNKGITYQLDNPKFWRAYDWRKLMEYFSLDLHRTMMMDDLGDHNHYVAAGALYDIAAWLGDLLHFSGNMWVARCSYVNTLPRIATYDKEPWQYRYMSEMWIGSGPDFKEHHKNCWNHWDTECTLDAYACDIPEERYASQKVCGRAPPPAGVKIVDHFNIAESV